MRVFGRRLRRAPKTPNFWNQKGPLLSGKNISFNPDTADFNAAMDREIVHFHLTKQWALETDGLFGEVMEYLAAQIAQGNRDMDLARSVISLVPSYHRLVHFASWEEAVQCVRWAIYLGNPYIFGATLHQIQDYFSHYGEGYRMGSFGHSHHLLRWRLRNESLMQRFYDLHPRTWVEERLSGLYPEMSFAQVTDWELVDLYLRERSVSEWKERGVYGYNPDLYYEHTWRDRGMERATRCFLREYILRVRNDPVCLDRVARQEYGTNILGMVRFYTLVLTKLAKE